MCHLNSTESIRSCSHFGALNSSYTLPSLSYQVLIFTWVKWSIWGLSVWHKNTTSKQCPNIERRETWYFSENPAPSGIRNRTAGSDIDKAPRSNHRARSLSNTLLYIAGLSTNSKLCGLIEMYKLILCISYVIFECNSICNSNQHDGHLGRVAKCIIWVKIWKGVNGNKNESQ